MNAGAMVILVSGLLLGQAATQNRYLGPEDVWRLVRQAAGGIEDVTFQWDYSADLTGRDLGDVPNPTEGIVGKGEVYYSFDGFVRTRLTMAYTIGGPIGSKVVQKTRRLWSWDGMQISEKQFHPPPGRTVGRVIQVKRKPDPDLIPYLGDSSLSGFALPLLQVSLDGASNESWRFSFRGWQELDGQNCLVLSIFWDMEHAVEDRYYLDVSRGGHPVRIEGIRNGRTISVRKVLEWCRVDAGGGREWYLPQEVETLELYCRKRLGPGKYVELYRGEDDPFTRGVWRLRCESVKVNTGLRREDVVVDLQDLSRVDDLTLAAVKAQQRAAGSEPVRQVEEQPLVVPVDPGLRKKLLQEQKRNPDALRANRTALWWRRHWVTVLLVAFGVLAVFLGLAGLWWFRR